MLMARIALSANTAWNLANFRRPIIEALLERGDEVVVVAGQDDSQVRLQDIGCTVLNASVDAKGSNPVRDTALALELRRYYSRTKPDAVLNFTIKPVIYGTLAASSLGIPVINTITGLGTAFIKDNWITRVVETLYRQALPRSAQVLFQNGDDLELFRNRNLLGSTPFSLVAGSGIDLEHFAPSALPGETAVTFLMIARLLRDKGVKEFVEAARIIKAEHRDVRFQLLGPFGVENRTAITNDELVTWVNEGIIEYLGTTDDVRPFIARSTCVVLPSYREGMPRVLLEAAAMGRPLIATNVTGCREVVDHGINGLLCAARDALDLAHKMQDFLGLDHVERQRMGDASRGLAETHFDVHKVVQQYLDLVDAQLREFLKDHGS